MRKRGWVAGAGIAFILGQLPPSAGSDQGVAVAGGGSTFVQSLMGRWTTDFNAKTGAAMTYSGFGSEAGRAKLVEGSVDFAGSDTPASTKEADSLRTKYKDFVYVADTAGGISVFFRVDGLPKLELTGKTLAQIFSGAIDNWNDPAIAADNGKPGPDLPITVFVRAGKSGTSAVFTDYLSRVAYRDWPGGKTETFPTDGGQTAKDGAAVLVDAVAATNGAIGYGDHAYAKGRKVSEAAVRNAGGKAQKPTAASVTAAVEEATYVPDGTVIMDYRSSDPDVYPISCVSYVLAPVRMDMKKGDNLKAFLDYLLTWGQESADPLGYAPLPAKLVEAARKQASRINA